MVKTVLVLSDGSRFVLDDDPTERFVGIPAFEGFVAARGAGGALLVVNPAYVVYVIRSDNTKENL